MKNLVLFGAIVIVLGSFSSVAFGTPTCEETIQLLASCEDFIKGNDPPPSCCTGLDSLNASVKTPDDRVKVCQCAKDGLSQTPYDPKRIPLLPKACGVDIILPPLDKTTDCTKW